MYYIPWDNKLVNDFYKIVILRYKCVNNTLMINHEPELLEKWCRENIRGKMMKTGHLSYWIFEDEIDATAFKLRWYDY